MFCIVKLRAQEITLLQQKQNLLTQTLNCYKIELAGRALEKMLIECRLNVAQFQTLNLRMKDVENTSSLLWFTSLVFAFNEKTESHKSANTTETSLEDLILVRVIGKIFEIRWSTWPYITSNGLYEKFLIIKCHLILCKICRFLCKLLTINFLKALSLSMLFVYLALTETFCNTYLPH